MNIYSQNKDIVMTLLIKPKKAWTKPYLTGQTAYVDEEWGTMVEAMEDSLRLYLKSVRPFF